MFKKQPFWLIIACLLVITISLAQNKIQTNSELSTNITPSPTHQPVPTQATNDLTQKILGEKNLEEVKVERVVDGDTIKLSDGRTLRYIGIDTPETVDPRREVQCFGKDASEYNNLLVTGKTVYLEKDVSETDRYGRLLRYVYLQSGEMVNEMLVREGYAQSSSYPPDIKYQNQFDKLEQQAREKNIGLWGSCDQTNTQEPITLDQFKCDCSKTCSTISTCSEATFQLSQCRCKNLDGNNDGIACNSLCR